MLSGLLTFPLFISLVIIVNSFFCICIFCISILFWVASNPLFFIACLSWVACNPLCFISSFCFRLLITLLFFVSSLSWVAYNPLFFIFSLTWVAYNPLFFIFSLSLISEHMHAHCYFQFLGTVALLILKTLKLSHSSLSIALSKFQCLLICFLIMSVSIHLVLIFCTLSTVSAVLNFFHVSWPFSGFKDEEVWAAWFQYTQYIVIILHVCYFVLFQFFIPLVLEKNVMKTFVIHDSSTHCPRGYNISTF